MADVLNTVFDAVRDVLWTYGGALDVKVDTATRLSIDTPCGPVGDKPHFFGAVEVRKAHVSFHFMPVYDAPALLAGIPPELRARMHGKACFNFAKVDAALIAALSDLVRAGYDHYAVEGLVPQRQGA